MTKLLCSLQYPLTFIQVGGGPGRAGEGVGEQGARQHHHAGALGQGRLDKFVRNKALDMMFNILCLLGLGTMWVN